MAPTRSNEEIGGRSYKEYAYSPVPMSSSAVLAAVTPDGKSVNVELNAVHDKKFDETPLCVIVTHRPDSMTEKGSKLVQFLAAAAGKCPPKGRALERAPDAFLDSLESDSRSLMAFLSNNSSPPAIDRPAVIQSTGFDILISCPRCAIRVDSRLLYSKSFDLSNER